MAITHGQVLCHYIQSRFDRSNMTFQWLLTIQVCGNGVTTPCYQHHTQGATTPHFKKSALGVLDYNFMYVMCICNRYLL